LLKKEIYINGGQFIDNSFVILQYTKADLETIYANKTLAMFKKLLSLLLGGKNPKPAYAYIPKQQNTRMPQKKRN
jgi:hypothetical protein